jgi:hypothetical protein
MDDRYAGGAENPVTAGRDSLKRRIRTRARGGGCLRHQTHPLVSHNVLAKGTKDSLTADGWVQEKPYRETVDTGASICYHRQPDIVAGLPERKLSRSHVLQTASGETIPVVKEAHGGRCILKIWVFVADVTDFILGLDILQA